MQENKVVFFVGNVDFSDKKKVCSAVTASISNLGLRTFGLYLK